MSRHRDVRGNIGGYMEEYRQEDEYSEEYYSDDDYEEVGPSSSISSSLFDQALAVSTTSKKKNKTTPAKPAVNAAKAKPATNPTATSRPLNTHVDRNFRVEVSHVKPGQEDDMEELNKAVGDTLIIRQTTASSDKLVRVAPNTSSFLKKKKQLVDEEVAVALTAKPTIHLVVAGHVDSGKSTLIGHMLLKQGRVTSSEMRKLEIESKATNKASFKYAWVLDQNATERSRGMTVDVGLNWFETPNHRVVVLDCPGHRDFVPNMISGASQADAGVLVIAATPGEFEAGFSEQGQTREHATLLKALGVTQLVVAINKMDMCDISGHDFQSDEFKAMQYTKSRFDEIVAVLQPYLATLGFSSVNFVPISGIEGINLSTKPPASNPLSNWYTGNTLIHHIDLFTPQSGPTHATKPFRMVVADVFSTLKHGLTASGKVTSGAIVPKERLLLLPQGVPVMVKALEKSNNPIKAGIAGEAVDIALKEVSNDEIIIKAGDILCDIEHPVPLVSVFKATIMTAQTRSKIPILPGSQFGMYSQSATEMVTISKILGVVHTDGGLTGKSTEYTLKKARFIPSGATAQVEITIPAGSEMCLETQSDYPELSRFTLRRDGDTAAVGAVEEIISKRN